MNTKKITDLFLFHTIGRIGLNKALKTISEDDIINDRTSKCWKKARECMRKDSDNTYSESEALEIFNSYEEIS